jgi:hypothetical protein
MKIIGRKDKADFPELHLQNINIKVDTGAFTSSIHSHDIKEVEVNGKRHIEFKLLDPSYTKYKNKIFKVKDYKEKAVKSSFGDIEHRYIIKTIIVIFAREYPIELSLSQRTDMKFPILLGRKFLNKQFMVNTSLKNISYKLKLAEKKNNQ